ncbi:four helix bundle protein [Echinicola soli]|uniref:Four helix bundle protein n=1 Tax=Echinicola soli TaxID=2591634 RepID=A0A514CEA3_9BACT|nr:four helix bundle protein [Echinicola soli]QDH78149.1 four helix bundle protein [Echinicola soli]
MHRYKELQVWKNATELAVDIYEITEKLPKQEKFGLISQINRAVVSIPSNIAEGAGRNSNKDFDRFLGIALGSAFELDTQLIISNKLDYIEKSDYVKVSKNLETIHNMIFGLKRSLNK